ncbi:hypothetical protein COCON_G00070650 [Conger conger]|uniref:Ig-like domain-containing protein n=1 Tax=Conger conger TaxID=82655 RepID=A0A9Q1DTG7_CONCO|nr:hypothetical protein COCON_G00070650 [Conger conger]
MWRVVVWLLILGLPALGCPSGCRCYSLTVECGSVGLQEVPPHAPPTTQTFFLQDNAIGQIRQWDLSALGQLRYLYLQNNSISALEPGAFRGQAQLLELALNRNRIHLLSADTFQGLEHLRVLYLSGNRITRLQDHTFRCLQRLQELHLQENSVEVLSEEALVGLSSLALLDLSRNSLRTLQQGSLRPLASLQLLRVTVNPWLCDCALLWFRRWMSREGQRLLNPGGRRLLCASPPRLAQRPLLEVPGSSLVCIPPLLRLEPRRQTLRPGAELRVSCQASGFPQPQVSWRRGAPGAPGGRGGEGAGEAEARGGRRFGFGPDTGSGMLLLSNVTPAHAGPYECEARNAGGVSRLTFHLSVNTSSSSSPSSPWRARRGRDSYPGGGAVSREPLRALTQGSMDFHALGPGPQAGIAAGIALLALTSLLLLALICSRHLRHRLRKEGEGEGAAAALFANDAPLALPQEYRRGRLYALPPASRHQEALSRAQGRAEGDGREAEPADALCPNQSLLFDTRVAYEIHC